MIVVPIAFVSEHSETLVELDIEYRELAEEAGVPKYTRCWHGRLRRGVYRRFGRDSHRIEGEFCRSPRTGPYASLSTDLRAVPVVIIE